LGLLHLVGVRERKEPVEVQLDHHEGPMKLVHHQVHLDHKMVLEAYLYLRSHL
jgi:hypothetical protein